MLPAGYMLARSAHLVFAHLTAERAPLYRAVLGAFVRAKQRFALHLRPADIERALSIGGGDSDLAGVGSALAQLVEWGNLEAHPDTADVASVEEFYRPRYLYQLTVAGEAADHRQRGGRPRPPGVGQICTSSAQGAVSSSKAVGTIPLDLGIFWDATSRVLYVSQPHSAFDMLATGETTINRFQIASDRTMTTLMSIGAKSSYCMAMTPCGELLVTDYNGNSISRFLIDAQGNPGANGTITGGGLSNSVDLKFASWGELFVSNQGTGTISRFTFDSAHNAVPGTAFQTPSGPSPNGAGNGTNLDYIVISP